MGAASVYGPSVRIHRNLHNARKGGPQWTRTERGKVVEYLDAVALRDVTTRVRQGGIRRCQEKGQREVCAFFDGFLVDPADLPTTEPEALVRFDPRYDSQFFAAGFDVPGGRFAFRSAEYVLLAESGAAYVWGAK
jgi:hypothetical protein